MNIIFILPLQLSQEELSLIEKRLSEFKLLQKADNKRWFSELCFCILTANSQAKKAIAIQESLTDQDFLSKTQEELAFIIRCFNHRFHNNKARYIVEARKYSAIKDILRNMTEYRAREFLVSHIKGIGYKEASHFLRNVGYADCAIIDRHILKFLVKYNFIAAVPKVITKKIYLELENLLRSFGIPLDKLDLILWYHMTGTVLK